MNVADWSAAVSFASWFVNLISDHRVKSNYLWCLVFDEASGALTTIAPPTLTLGPSHIVLSSDLSLSRWPPWDPQRSERRPRVPAHFSHINDRCVVWEALDLKGRAIYCDTKEALIGRRVLRLLAVSGRVNRCVIGGAAYSVGEVL